MSKKIFVEKKVKCPACQAAFDLTYPNPKLYAASGRDEDQRVTGYSWTAGIDTTVLPHHFSVLQCPACLFAEFLEKLEKPRYDPKARQVYQKLKELPFDQKMILRKFRRLVPQEAEKLDTNSAIAIHLAAIFTALLPASHEAIDHLKLGRLYLRLSWLFRELKGEGSGAAEASAEKPKGPRTIYNMGKLGEKIENHMHTIQDLLEEFREMTETRTRELNLSPGQNPYLRSLNAVENYFDQSLQELAKLEELVIKDKKKILVLKAAPESSKKETPAGGETENLEELLESVSGQWPQVPKDEASAVKLALEAFDYSINHEGAAQDIKQGMSLGTLLVFLYMKTGHLEKALDYSVNIYKTGFRDKQQLQAQLNQAQKDESMSDAEIKEMNRELAVVSSAVEKAGDNRKKLLEMLYERDKDRVSTVLKANAGAAPEQLAKAFAGAGFHEEFAAYLNSRIAANNNVKKKKKFGR